MAEWLNAAVLKTAGLRRAREFESHLFRQETLKESKLSNETWIFLLIQRLARSHTLLEDSNQLVRLRP